jgi:hypothetical protein
MGFPRDSDFVKSFREGQKVSIVCRGRTKMAGLKRQQSMGWADGEGSFLFLRGVEDGFGSSLLVSHEMLRTSLLLG